MRRASWKSLTAWFGAGVILGGCSAGGAGTGAGDANGEPDRAAEVTDVQLADQGPPEELLDQAGEVEAVAEAESWACPPGKGCFMDKCKENEDCLAGWCVEHMGERVCSQECQEECQPGWACTLLGGAGPDLVFACTSKHTNLCKPCSSAAGCVSSGGSIDVCVDYGKEGFFCGGACGEEQACPWGFSCKDVQSIDGLASKQCVADTGVCPCTATSSELSLWTPCKAANEWGTCEGKRVCDAEGLSACDAPEPAQEVCNGVDDDCDGQTDEPDAVRGSFLNLCEDDNPCTEDACQGESGCAHATLDGGECMDGDACTMGDHCQAGACVGTPILCADGNPCTTDTCDGQGGCAFEFNQDDCDDGNPCTVADECDEGVCAGFDVSCECTGDTDCAVLDDGNACNGTLKCDAAVMPHKCVVDPATVVACPAPEGEAAACKQSACVPETGECAVGAANEGFLCSDGSACTLGDVCAGGECVPGIAANCADDNPCTQDSCQPETGCVHEPAAGDCSDGDPCTEDDACVDGVCKGSPSGCDDGNVCTADSCLPGSGCLHQLVAGPCDDKDPCTVGDHCQLGVCESGMLQDCGDGDPCSLDTCEEDGSCGHSPAPAKTPCDDGDPCTIGDQCLQGKCTGTPSLDCCQADQDCDDGNPCTDDTCMVAVGACLSKPGNGGKCDADGNGCTADACIEGKCVVGGPVPCPPPLNPCKDAVCASTGPDAHDCVDVPSALGTPCEDGLFCTKESSCDGGGGCVGGKTVDCSQLSGGCIGGMCNEALDKCEGQPVLDGTPCEDDQLVCTKDACTAGMCGHAMTAGTCLIEGSCRADGEKPAGNPCKVCSSKDSPFAWWSVAQGTACADNLACTSETVCQANGVCGGGKQVSPQQCADLLGNKNPCLVGACVEPQGCMLKPGQDGAACSAANALVAVCVGGDCKVSECKPGYGNCDGSSANGCEADVAGSVANCGGCGKACQAGGKYAHAAVACVASKCVFQGCLEGFQDINGDCAGAGPCTDGCEEGVCVPIVDGTVEIPDDGKDNDCQGGDAGNEEAEGYYVDINFPFGDGCAKPGLGTRSCPFQYVWSALVACQFEQDWSQPTKVKREIYVAKGDYVEIGTVADVSKPVVVAGGYERTLEGPWKRDWTKHVTLLKSNSGMAVIAAPDVPGWAVFDGLGITQQVNVLGRLVLRHVNKVGQAPALKVAADADKAVLELLESSVSGDVSGGNADKWVLDGNKIGGSVKCNSAANDWVVNSNVIGGDLAPGSSATGWKAKGNVIQGTYSCPYCSTWELEGNEFQKEMTVNYAHDWKVAGNTFHAKINAYSCSNWTLTGNTFEGILSGSSSTWKLTGNTLKAGVSAGNSWIMRNNIVMGPVAGDGQWQLVNNTFFALPGQAGAWVTMNGAQWAIVNNAFVWNGSQAEGYYALKEAGANADPKIVRGNAFINFDGANGGFLLNEGTTPVTNIVLLNNSSELPSCGRGDNLAYDDVAAVAFASVDPSSKDFLKLTAGSTGLIDKGDALPSVCESVKVEASVVDLAGNKVPCGAKPDIGAYEFCGP